MKFLIFLSILNFVNGRSYLSFSEPAYQKLPRVSKEKLLILTPFLTDFTKTHLDIQQEILIQHPIFQGLECYSGFFSVDEKFDSHMFFVLVKAENDNEGEKPLVLSLNGGPGVPSLFGMMYENGPVTPINGTFEANEFSWHKRANMLYIDNPVGTGFSFTNSTEGYSTNQNEIAKNLYESLKQFFKIFPELKSRDFYISGQSYAGKYCATLGEKIMKENSIIQLKGILVGSSWIEPYNQLNYADYFYQTGLIAAEEKSSFDRYKYLVQFLIKSGNFKLAAGVFKISVDKFINLTGFPAFMNYANEDDPDDLFDWTDLTSNKELREALHVGYLPLVKSDTVRDFLVSDYMDSVVPSLNYLISKDIRMIFYNGQFDIATPYVLMVNTLKSLDFKEKKLLKETPRIIWKVNGKIAGFTRTAGPLTEVLVRKAGHLIQADQPELIFDLFDRFIENKTFD